MLYALEIEIEDNPAMTGHFSYFCFLCDFVLFIGGYFLFSASATADAIAKFAVWVMLMLICLIPSLLAISSTSPQRVTSG